MPFKIYLHLLIRNQLYLFLARKSQPMRIFLFSLYMREYNRIRLKI